MDEKDLFWSGLMDYILNQPTLNKNNIDFWLSPVKIHRIDHDYVSIIVPNILSKMYWEKVLTSHILDYSEQNFGKKFQPKYIISPSHDEFHNQDTSINIEKTQVLDNILTEEPVESDHYTQSPLNPIYTFENFVIGEGNKMANAAALTVTDRPGSTYNPFLIYGGAGLGKTHLMQAIGNEILRRNPNTRIKYATTESFMNDFITSLQKKNQAEFRKMYREIDVLLIDDIQFLTKNKEGTKEEFFHTFNALYNDDKQIVLTCDRLPSSIEGLEDRLVSRFKWGLSADITPPDFETRIAILRKKAGNDFNAETLTYIANHISTNVRELEGALLRVKAFSAIHGHRDITVSLVAEALQGMIGETAQQGLSIDKIIQQISQFYHVSIHELKGKKRNKEIVYPRQIAMYLSRELTDASFPKIGEEFGNRNHTTVIHAYEKVQEQLKQNMQLKQELNLLKQQLQQ